MLTTKELNNRGQIIADHIEQFLMTEYQPIYYGRNGQIVEGKGFVFPGYGTYYSFAEFPFLDPDAKHLTIVFPQTLRILKEPKYINVKGKIKKTFDTTDLKKGEMPFINSKTFLEVIEWQDLKLETFKSKIFPNKKSEFEFLLDAEFANILYEDYESIRQNEFDEKFQDGFEIPQKFIPLLPIATPMFNYFEDSSFYHGGFHSGILGRDRNVNSFSYRMQNITESHIFKYLNWYAFEKTSNKEIINSWITSKTKEVTYIAKKVNEEQSLDFSTDFTIEISNSPTLKSQKEENMFNSDISNYLSSKRLHIPLVRDKDLLIKISKKVTEIIQDYQFPPNYTRYNALFDLNYMGRPFTVMRLASGLARFSDNPELDKYIPKAIDIFRNECDIYKDSFYLTQLDLTRFERQIVNQIRIVEKSFPFPGILLKEIHTLIKNVDKLTLDDIILSLIQKGACYYSRPGYLKSVEI